jgi:Dullard-like phosphatase family protein
VELETPERAAEAPKDVGENDDTTPPKGFNINVPRRDPRKASSWPSVGDHVKVGEHLGIVIVDDRRNMLLEVQFPDGRTLWCCEANVQHVEAPKSHHAQLGQMGNLPLRKDIWLGKSSSKKSDLSGSAQQVQSQGDIENRPPAAEPRLSQIARQQKADLENRPPAAEPLAQMARRQKEWSRSAYDPVNVATPSKKMEKKNRPVSDTSNVPTPSRDNVRPEALPEFAVTASRYTREHAKCALEELPNSLRHALMFVRNIPALPCTTLAGRRPILPPAQPDVRRRPTLVLDLDETLVHCSRSSSSRSTPFPAKPDLIVTFDDQPSTGAVAFRPYAKLFLEATAKAYELVIFTASQQSYADKVINALDPDGTLIAHRLYRQHCTELKGAFFKELSLLGRPVHQCVLVDNSPISVACNPDNSVLIRSWYDDPKDKELCDLLVILQDMQLRGEDCSQYLANRYGLRDFIQGLRAGAGHTCP